MLTALQELANFPRDLRLNSVTAPCDPIFELRPLDAAVVAMKAAAASVRPPDPAKIKGLVERCKEQGYRLDGFQPREVRLMAWDSELLTNPVFRYHLASLVRSGTVRPNILLLSKVYFGDWGRHTQPELFEQMLRILAHSQNGYTATLRLYKESADDIFSGTAHTFLSRIVAQERQALLSVLSAWDVGITTPLASSVIDSYIGRTLVELSRGRQVLTELISVLGIPTVTTITFQQATAAMILCDQAEKGEADRKIVESFVLDHPRLGDPRLPQNIPKWVGVDPAAERKFRTWRATKDLVFFFNAVMRVGNDRHGRKEFWLRYVDKVVDSVVALCPTDLQRLRQSLSSDRVHYCRILDNQQVSCFMMRFKGFADDIVVAEFSNVGRARIFFYRKFVENVGDINKSEFRLKELRTDEGLAESFVHMGTWQKRVRNKLAQFGVRTR